MKKLALVASVLAFSAVSASAADLSPRTYTKAPAMAPIAVTNWTGFYVGGEGGYGWARDSLFFPGPLTTTGRFNTSGGVAGGVLGYNWQLANTGWVFGLEGNFDWANIRGSATCPNPALSCRTSLNDIFTGTGRIGYAWNSTLLYAKGGYAWTQDRADVVVPATGAINDSTGRTGRDGYTLGVGVEYMFAPSWSAKLEYDYYNFNSKTLAATTPAGVFVENINLTSYSVNTVKAGVNYHFNWGGPVVAKY